MIAFQLAVSEPDLFRGLIIINSGPELIFRTLKEKFPFFMRRVIVRLFGMRKMGTILANNLFPKPEQRALRDQLIERWSENDKESYIASIKALSNWTVMDKIHAIKFPALIISADMDYAPVTWKEFYASKIAGAEVAVIRDSRHMTPLEQPEQLNQTIMNFLSKVD
jgi:3-oxoadipate enol-lactonase